MKNLLPIAVFITLFTISFSAQSQQILKFIDGIELKSGLMEYSSSLPTVVETKILGEKKVVANLSAGLRLATEACKSLQFKYAQLMDVEIEAVANFSMFQFINEWWNTKYRYGGDSKKGIDCSAFSGLLLNTVYGFVMPRTAKEQYTASQKIKREELQEGDLLFFNTRGGVSHVGVYLSNDYFVHASVREGVTISSLNDAYYNRKFIGCTRASHEKTLVN